MTVDAFFIWCINVLFFFSLKALDYGVPSTQPAVQTSPLPTRFLHLDLTTPSTWLEVKCQRKPEHVNKLVLHLKVKPLYLYSSVCVFTVFSGMNLPKSEPQQSWPEFTTVPSSIWDIPSSDPLHSWPSSSSSPTAPTAVRASLLLHPH